MHFIRQGNRLTPIASVSFLEDGLRAGYYRVGCAPDGGFYLEEAQEMTMPQKVYGSVDKRADRVFTTYKSRSVSTGVLLMGDKGSGKTMLARKICIRAVEDGQPVLICDGGSQIGNPAFAHFLGSFTFPFVALFDEFEKNFERLDHQASLLSLMDGLAHSRKLFLLTTNERQGINPFMLDRPGRIFYAFNYQGLDFEIIKEYCADKHLPEDTAHAFLRYHHIYGNLNFDIMQSVAEEMLRYDLKFSEAIDGMNVGGPIGENRWIAHLRVNGGALLQTGKYLIYPLEEHDNFYLSISGLIQDMKNKGSNAAEIKAFRRMTEPHADADGDINFRTDEMTTVEFNDNLSGMVLDTKYPKIQIVLVRSKKTKQYSSLF